MKLQQNDPMKYAAWISPDGKIYSCPREGHVYLAWRICENLGIDDDTSRPDDEIIKRGWLKLTSEGDVYQHINKTITQKQLDALSDILAAEFTTDPPAVIKDFGGMGDRYIHGNPEEWNKNLKNAMDMYIYHDAVV